MNPLVYHIVSGHSFFTGVVLVVVAVWVSTKPRPLLKRLTVVGFLLGVVAVAVSSTPNPPWLFGITVVATIWWILSAFRRSWRIRSASVTMIAWLTLGIAETPYHLTPTMQPLSAKTITVIGDSVTAGIGGDETSETWPSILTRQHQVAVQDISHIGETVSSALKRLQANPIKGQIVIAEIGGNDVLGSTSAEQFEKDLDEFLAHVTADGRQVVMFELPLPPFCSDYGRAQRILASRYNVCLIPKRVLLSVIAGGDATLDSIHLSQAGHQSMADAVWKILNPAFSAEPHEQRP